MSLTLKRNEIKNARIVFIPVDTVVGSTTVAQETWPADGDAIWNADTWEFEEISGVAEEIEYQEETLTVSDNLNGGYRDKLKKTPKTKSWVASTPQTNSLIKQLEDGLENLPSAGVGQRPFSDKCAASGIYGILYLEQRDACGDTVIKTTKVWTQLSLDNIGETAPTTAVATARFRTEGSTLDLVTHN